MVRSSKSSEVQPRSTTRCCQVSRWLRAQIQSAALSTVQPCPSRPARYRARLRRARHAQHVAAGVDPGSGHDLGAGERGELWIRGPQVMAGYLGNPRATAGTIDADGWLKTGDLGYVDGEGNVFVVDRLKELIKVSAYGVAPAELEAVLLTHPNVADAAVVGRPDEERGEIPVAAVVPRGDLDADALMDWVAEKVAPHKKIRAVRFVDAIPKTPSGKLLRRVLAEQDRRSVLQTST
jgi:acyl-CoA synthetase (AMP-forming)/AMP-acid ligase II